jgi:hypothetical protein
MMRNVEKLLTFSGGLCNFVWSCTCALDASQRGVASLADTLQEGSFTMSRCNHFNDKLDFLENAWLRFS